MAERTTVPMRVKISPISGDVDDDGFFAFTRHGVVIEVVTNDTEAVLWGKTVWERRLWLPVGKGSYDRRVLRVMRKARGIAQTLGGDGG